MQKLLEKGAQSISLFCRQNLTMNKNIPIRSSEMGLLIYIVNSTKPVIPAMASKFFRVSKPMIAKMITSLVQKKYIVKQLSKKDKRSYYLIPLDKAKKLVLTATDEYTKTVHSLINKMGIEKYKQLIELIDEANIHLEGTD